MAKQITPPPAAVLDFNEKNFRPSVVETELYDWWERSGFFTPPDRPSRDEKRFVMMLPLPNVTGDLHMGHALGFGGYEDLMARWHRMKGEATLYLPGTDHAGIIAQILVEKELAKEMDKKGLGREQFLAEMWKWMRYYQPRIYRQLRMLGCSLDWTRVHFTMDPDMQRRVRVHFIRLYKKGHLFRADRIVHWCLTCQTTFSDLELLHETRTDQLSFVKYPWAEKMPAGTPDVIVATTRPETIVADVAVAVHPDDERWKPYVGKEVLVPMVERRVKIITDEAVDPQFGTGALKVTPGHDATDFEIGQRHNLTIISAIDKDGRMNGQAGILAGAHRDAARKKAIEVLKQKGLLVRQEPITHAVGIHDRCGTIEEPLVMRQWFMAMKELARPAIVLPGLRRDGRAGRRRARSDGVCEVPEQRPQAGSRRARHVVLVSAVATQHPWMAREDARSRTLLSRLGARDGLRHHLFLGRPHDHDGHREHGRRALHVRVSPRPRARFRRARTFREDV
ncbi:MAG: hypothetical protein E6J38_13835, partial [Chloroflexi bacterium]